MIKKAFDSTSKIIEWAWLLLSVAMVVVIMCGWYAGHEDAAEMFATVIGSDAVVVGANVWKSKVENAIKLSQPFGKKYQKEVLKQVLGAESEEM